MKIAVKKHVIEIKMLSSSRLSDSNRNIIKMKEGNIISICIFHVVMVAVDMVTAVERTIINSSFLHHYPPSPSSSKKDPTTATTTLNKIVRIILITVTIDIKLSVDTIDDDDVNGCGGNFSIHILHRNMGI